MCREVENVAVAQGINDFLSITLWPFNVQIWTGADVYFGQVAESDMVGLQSQRSRLPSAKAQMLFGPGWLSCKDKTQVSVVK